MNIVKHILLLLAAPALIQLVCTSCMLSPAGLSNQVHPAGTTRPEANGQGQPLRLTIDLADGSRVVGVPNIVSIPVQTAYANLDVALIQVRSITMEKDRELAVFEMKNGDRIKGAMLLKKLDLRTVFGTITVEAWQINKIRVSSIDTTVMRGANAGNTWSYSRKWGSSGSGDGQLNSPHSIALAANGQVFVADTGNNRIQVFEQDGTFVRKWGSKGSGNGLFNAPYVVVLNSNGQAFVSEGYVSSGYNHRIQVFEADGTFVRKWGSYGPGDAQFKWPFGLVVTTNGQIFVADRDNNRIQVFEADGTFVRQWGSAGSGDGQLNYPTGLALTPDGRVVVGDYHNNRIEVFEADGTFVRKWGSFGSGDGQFKSPAGMAVGPDGRVYVADIGNHRIQVFESDGTFVCTFGSRGSGDGQLYQPMALALAPDGQLFVLDNANDRIQVFTVQGCQDK